MIFPFLSSVMQGVATHTTTTVSSGSAWIPATALATAGMLALGRKQRKKLVRKLRWRMLKNWLHSRFIRKGEKADKAFIIGCIWLFTGLIAGLLVNWVWGGVAIIIGLAYFVFGVL